MSDEKRNTGKPMQAKKKPSQCSCISDPYADLPVELRPRPQVKKGGLRQTTCPDCGQEYWTNRKTDVCISCERSGQGVG
jgi:hypothetical protein